MRLRWLCTFLLVLTTALSLSGCPKNPEPPPLFGQTKLTLLHTSDIHSRLFPYPLQIAQSDASLGLGPVDTIQIVGGAARIAHVIARERARADRVLHIDGGDCFQGAPVFNFFDGEAEIRALSAMGVDAQVIANHEFDKGAKNARTQYQKWGTFPVLAANYQLDHPDNINPELDNVLAPFKTFNVRGLKVGVIGMGNLSSLSSLYERPSRLGVTPLETVDVAQTYIDLLRPLVDLIVFVTHLGLDGDEEMIRHTTGIDVVLGGHNHVVLQPPKLVEDCGLVDSAGRHYIELWDADGKAKKRRYCEPRRVILNHSGAFAKYVGRLDLVVSDDPADIDWKYDKEVNGFEVVAHSFNLTPITADVPRDRRVAEVLEPYRAGLDVLLDLDLLVGYSPDGSRRFGTGGGDSPLGNLIASAMWRRLGVETDFSLTNTTGIRADMVPGPVTVEQMFNIFPFDNSITKMQLSGVEVQAMFDFVARRSAGRGCATQVQIAGARIVLNCQGCQTAKPTTCSTNSDCSSNECDLSKGQCVVRACAERIYIGYRSCKNDQECGNGGSCSGGFCSCTSDAACGGRQNACDLGVQDDQKRGRCLVEIDPTGSYELATSTYLAGGGSGFVVLKKNTTQLDTKIQQRDALVDWVRAGKPCGYSAQYATDDGLFACSTDQDCAAGGPGDKYVCACAGNAAESNGVCSSDGSCNGEGRCVLRKCRQDVSNFYRQACRAPETAVAMASCASKVNPCQLGGEQCKFLGCINRELGSFSDGRVLTVGK